MADVDQGPGGPQLVGPNCWMVGRRNPESLLQCNTYVRSFEGRGSPTHVWIDPGSQLDFPVIKENVEKLVGGLSEIRSISLNHQDPDVIGNAMFAFEANPDVGVLVSEDVWRLAQHLFREPGRVDFTNPVRGKVQLGDSRNVWKLVPTPFCHFRGAVAFYDPELRTLFSGDLFGGLNRPGQVHLTAREEDWAGIAQFHQIYMPTREVLRYAVRQIRALDPPVKVIAPQHGYVITGDLVGEFLDRMEGLRVGHDLLEFELDEAYLAKYQEVFSRLALRAGSKIGRSEVLRRLLEPGDDDFEQLVTVKGGHIELAREGYVALVKALARLSWNEPLDFCNKLRDEVVSGCHEEGVPIPPVGTGLEEGSPWNFLQPEGIRHRAYSPGLPKGRRR